MEEDVTIKTLLEHMQASINGLSMKIDGLDTKVDSLEAKVDGIEAKVDSLDVKIDRIEGDQKSLSGYMNHLERNLNEFKTVVASNFQRIERKLDTNSEAIYSLQLTIVEQQHEKRIHRLEKHAGFVR